MMKKAEGILGYASCVLGLLPLMGDTVKAQPAAPTACQAVGINSGGAGTFPLANNPNPGGLNRLIVCGYTLAGYGAAGTGSAFLLTGFGTSCVSQGSITQVTLDEIVLGSTPVAFGRNGLAYVTQPGSSVCVFTGNGTSAFAASVSYAIQ